MMTTLSTMARRSRLPGRFVSSTFTEPFAARTVKPSSPSLSLPRRRRFSHTSIALDDSSPPPSSPDDVLSSFANLDHHRASRAGFPEAVFGQGKTPKQIHAILDSMADNVNRQIQLQSSSSSSSSSPSSSSSSSSKLPDASTAILATRVDRHIYDEILRLGPLRHGHMEYHDTARLISVRANAVGPLPETPSSPPSVVVACAGTTDLTIAEEAALTLSLSSVPVARLYDCGVAGLHRILSRLPTLRDPDVGCVVVCAGMDGALPSVVGGLVDVPVIAVPTSVGYGVSLGGVSAMLTMLNSCSPGVGVVNVDNGFGAAVLAMKCLRSRGKS